MTRLKKELEKRNIIFESDDMMIALKGIEYDSSAKLVGITDKFIITVMYSAVIDPILTLYDRFTLEPIGEQELYKDTQFGAFNPWHSFGFEDEEVDDYASNMPCDTYGLCAGSSCSNYYKCQC